MPIVEAVGSTAPLGRGVRGKMIQNAMAEALLAVQKESEAIWADPRLPPEQKNERIAALNTPEALRQRQLDARARAKVAYQVEADKAVKAQARAAKKGAP